MIETIIENPIYIFFPWYWFPILSIIYFASRFTARFKTHNWLLHKKISKFLFFAVFIPFIINGASFYMSFYLIFVLPYVIPAWIILFWLSKEKVANVSEMAGQLNSTTQHIDKE